MQENGQMLLVEFPYLASRESVVSRETPPMRKRPTEYLSFYC